MLSGTAQRTQPTTCEANSNITRQIAENLDCTTDNPQAMMTCLRTRSYDELINASYTIYVIIPLYIISDYSIFSGDTDLELYYLGYLLKNKPSKLFCK